MGSTFILFRANIHLERKDEKKLSRKSQKVSGVDETAVKHLKFLQVSSILLFLSFFSPFFWQEWVRTVELTNSKSDWKALEREREDLQRVCVPPNNDTFFQDFPNKRGFVKASFSNCSPFREILFYCRNLVPSSPNNGGYNAFSKRGMASTVLMKKKLPQNMSNDLGHKMTYFWPRLRNRAGGQFQLETVKMTWVLRYFFLLEPRAHLTVMCPSSNYSIYSPRFEASPRSVRGWFLGTIFWWKDHDRSSLL